MIFGSLSPGTNQNIITKLQNKSANRCCHCKNIPGNVFRPRRTTKKNYACLTRRTPPTHTAADQINYTITCRPCARVNETWIYQFTLESKRSSIRMSTFLLTAYSGEYLEEDLPDHLKVWDTDGPFLNCYIAF